MVVKHKSIQTPSQSFSARPHSSPYIPFVSLRSTSIQKSSKWTPKAIPWKLAKTSSSQCSVLRPKSLHCPRSVSVVLGDTSQLVHIIRPQSCQRHPRLLHCVGSGQLQVSSLPLSQWLMSLSFLRGYSIRQRIKCSLPSLFTVHNSHYHAMNVLFALHSFLIVPDSLKNLLI